MNFMIESMMRREDTLCGSERAETASAGGGMPAVDQQAPPYDPSNIFRSAEAQEMLDSSSRQDKKFRSSPCRRSDHNLERDI